MIIKTPNKKKYYLAGKEVSQEDYEFYKQQNKKDRKEIVRDIKGIKKPGKFGRNFFSKRK